jgi:hypothetical protein
VADPVAVCADAVAGWHTSWLTAFGQRSERGREVWRAVDTPYFIYFAAITLRPEASAEAVLDAPGGICDSWQRLDLASHGYHVFREEPWFYRPAGPLPDSTPAELEVVRVSTAAEVEELELVSVRGFGNEEATIEPGAMHPTAVLDDPAMSLFVGRVDGKPIGASMGYRTDAAVGVFGVTTVASARRRGYGTALTRAAMQTDTGLPSVLAPSKEGESVYRAMGFESVGALTIWSKGDPAQ